MTHICNILSRSDSLTICCFRRLIPTPKLGVTVKHQWNLSLDLTFQQFSFYHRAFSEWNGLPEWVTNSSFEQCFKVELTSFLLIEEEYCNCSLVSKCICWVVFFLSGPRTPQHVTRHLLGHLAHLPTLTCNIGINMKC